VQASLKIPPSHSRIHAHFIRLAPYSVVDHLSAGIEVSPSSSAASRMAVSRLSSELSWHGGWRPGSGSELDPHPRALLQGQWLCNAPGNVSSSRDIPHPGVRILVRAPLLQDELLRRWEPHPHVYASVPVACSKGVGTGCKDAGTRTPHGHTMQVCSRNGAGGAYRPGAHLHAASECQ
jgi:hypothetical protein